MTAPGVMLTAAPPSTPRRSSYTLTEPSTPASIIPLGALALSSPPQPTTAPAPSPSPPTALQRLQSSPSLTLTAETTASHSSSPTASQWSATVTEASDTVTEASDTVTELSAGPTVLDQPFMARFKVLDMLANDRAILEAVVARPMDVDRWEIVIRPSEYLRRFRDSLADIQLVSRVPKRRLHTTYHRGPAFDHYLLLGEATHQLWVAARHKDAFLAEINRYNVVQAGNHAYQATLGNAHVSTAVFVHCLTVAGCETIRLKAYGQKMPIMPQFMQSEPADLKHPNASHNEWDIGTSFDSPYIWLFASTTGRRKGTRHYPVLAPGSRDFGTVKLSIKHHQRQYSVKIYPRLIHVIKSFNANLQGGVPKTLGGLRHQVAAALRMIHSLSGKGVALGGFRIEVTVQARSLAEATRLVGGTPFMRPGYWLGHDALSTPLPISARIVPRTAFLDGANWVYHQAQVSEVLHGSNGSKPTKQQVQVLTDVMNALGWNPGLRTATKSLAGDAWWNAPVPAQDTVFLELSELCQTDQEIQELFQAARRVGRRPQCLPCKRKPDDAAHRYQVHARHPFGLRCGFKACSHKLAGAAVVQWIAELVRSEVVDHDALVAAVVGH